MNLGLIDFVAPKAGFALGCLLSVTFQNEQKGDKA